MNAAGFSDPNIVKQDAGMQLLIRGSSSDSSKTSPMETRTIVIAYQWLFPTITADDGKLPTKADMVGKWKCAFEQWSDGKCDCNCGRWDWDCAGDRGIPEMYVTEKLDNDFEKINMNCPDGVGAIVEIPDLQPGELPPVCGEIMAKPDVYKFCEFGTGKPTATRAKAFTGLLGDGVTAFPGIDPSTSQNRVNVVAPEYMKYLWEVIELDSPLKKGRDVGTVVETLGVSAATANAYQAASLKAAKLYVDTDIMAQSHEAHIFAGGDEGMDGEMDMGGFDPMCLGIPPPPECNKAEGGAELESTKIEGAIQVGAGHESREGAIQVGAGHQNRGRYSGGGGSGSPNRAGLCA